MQVLKIVIPGTPVPKARARTFTDAKGKSRSITPDRTKDYERLIALHVSQAVAKMRTRGGWPTDVGYTVKVDVYPDKLCLLVIPNFKAAKRRGDLDNYAKAALDGLTKGGAWRDDYLVRELVVSSHFDEPNAALGTDLPDEAFAHADKNPGPPSP